MGRAGKNRRAEKRKQEKRRRKAAQQAMYESFMRDGKNKKSKRARLNSKAKSMVRAIRHAMVYCGNTGCKKCFPREKPELSKMKRRLAREATTTMLPL